MNFGVFTLCICFGQIFLGSTEITKERIRICVHDASDRFVDDFKVMYDTYEEDFLNNESFVNLLEWLNKIAPQNSKIDENHVRNISYSTLFDDVNCAEQKAKLLCDHMKIYQAMYPKKLPSERYNGIMNVFYIILNPNASTDQINVTLKYLYGIDTAATQLSFFDTLPELTGKDCPDIVRSYARTIDELRTMYHIKPMVVQDFKTIRDKFPCTDDVLYQLQRFLDLVIQFDGDRSKITACKIQEGSAEQFSSETTELRLQVLETIMPTRLTEDVFRGILDFENATLPGTPIKDIERALGYLYDHVPQSNCPIY